jgi:rubrerythrin
LFTAASHLRSRCVCNVDGYDSSTGSKSNLWFAWAGYLQPEILKKVKAALKGDHMETGHELFVHGLNDMLDAEHQLVDALEENANDSSRADLKKAFEQHRKETEGHIERLEKCF